MPCTCQREWKYYPRATSPTGPPTIQLHRVKLSHYFTHLTRPRSWEKDGSLSSRDERGREMAHFEARLDA